MRRGRGRGRGRGPESEIGRAPVVQECVVEGERRAARSASGWDGREWA